MSINELLLEANADENNNFLLKDRNIKNRLLSFRNYLIEKDMSENTIKTYLTKIKTFYKHFEIELPLLPNVKYEHSYQLNYSDLPTKEDISKVLEIVPLDLKAIILFMSSSGTAKAETLSLTVGDVIKGCDEYYSSKNLFNILNELSKRNDIVPTIYLKRLKTDKYYYTFCSPEASSCIIKYLKIRDYLNYEDKLFQLSNASLLNRFQKINDFMNWGRKGKYRFFRTHSLRKYHASNIGLPAEYVDSLQGRQKNVIHDAYIKTNPKKLKEVYIKNMRNVMIYSNDNFKNEDDTEEIKITINIFMSDLQITL